MCYVESDMFQSEYILTTSRLTHDLFGLQLRQHSHNTHPTMRNVQTYWRAKITNFEGHLIDMYTILLENMLHSKSGS